MSRKNWSNLFLLIAAVNLTLGVAPNNPYKATHWIVLPALLSAGAYLRRRMI